MFFGAKENLSKDKKLRRCAKSAKISLDLATKKLLPSNLNFVSHFKNLSPIRHGALGPLYIPMWSERQSKEYHWDQYVYRFIWIWNSLDQAQVFWSMVHPRPLLQLVSSFQTNNTIQTTNICEKNLCPSSKWHRDLNPQPPEHESPPITTRPGTGFFVTCVSDPTLRQPWVNKDRLR